MTERRVIKLLLVEDNPSDVAQIRRALATSRLLEFGVTHTDFLNSALTYLMNPTDGQFDVIFLDLNLQDSRGIDTVTAVHSAAPEIPIVVLSGQEDIKIADLTLQCGAIDFVVKKDIGEHGAAAVGDELERKAWFALRRQEQYLTTQTLTRMSMEKAGARLTADPALVHAIRENVRALEDGILDMRTYLQLHAPAAWDALSSVYTTKLMVPLRNIRTQFKLEEAQHKRTVLKPGSAPTLESSLATLTTSPLGGNGSSMEEIERDLLAALHISPRALFGDDHE